MFAYGMPKTPKDLSVRFRDAYDTSYRAAVDDTSDEVVDARKRLRAIRTDLKKKLRDVVDICEAATVVDHPIKTKACEVANVVRTDYLKMLKELERIRKPSKKKSTTARAPKPKSGSRATKKPMTFTKAVVVLKKHHVISSSNELMKRGNATGGFLLSRL